MRLSLSFLAGAALPALLLAGCAVAPGSSPAAEPTVVSLNPCTDAIAAELAAPGQLLAISHYSKDPSASSMDRSLAGRFHSTGGTVEEVLALDPDLVLASTFLAPSTRRALEDLGIRVETFGIASSVAESLAQVERMGQLLDRPDEARALSAEIAGAVSAMRGPAKPVDAVLWQPGGIVPGEATLVGELLRETGFGSHSAARGLGQASYLPLEAVLADPPRLLLVAGNDRGQHHGALQRVEGMTVARFDPALLYCGGPTIIQAAERLKQVRESAS